MKIRHVFFLMVLLPGIATRSYAQSRYLDLSLGLNGRKKIVPGISYLSGASSSVDFTVDKKKATVKDTVRFTSSGTFISCEWAFFPPLVTYLQGTNSLSANPVVKFNSPFKYGVSLTVFTGSNHVVIDKSEFIEIVPFTSVGALIDAENPVVSYPNPASSSITIELNGLGFENVNCEIYNVQGMLLHAAEIKERSFTFDLPYLPGIYFINIKSPDGKQWVKKIVKE